MKTQNDRITHKWMNRNYFNFDHSKCKKKFDFYKKVKKAMKDQALGKKNNKLLTTIFGENFVKKHNLL